MQIVSGNPCREGGFGCSLRLAVCSVVLLLAATSAPAQPKTEDIPLPDQVSERDRVWWNFNRETAVVGAGKLRLALRGEIINKGTNDRHQDLTGFPLDDFERLIAIQTGKEEFVRSVEGGRFDLRAAYGLGSTAEIGFDLPFYTQSIKFFGDNPDINFVSDQPTINNEGTGDLVLYGKFRRHLSNRFTVGGGLEIWTPTGSERKRLGTGELGFNPFFNMRYDFDHIAFGGHMGFLMYPSDFIDVFNYSVYTIVRRSETLAFRLELNGRHYKEGDEYNDLSVLPGLDWSLTERVTLRPQGRFHLTDEAWEWGAGVAIVVELL